MCYTSISKSVSKFFYLLKNMDYGTEKAVSRLSFLFAETVKINIKTSKIFYKTLDIRIDTCYNIFRS
nr:MAG TPA: hypothetical protein [Caudoviricetes sp.]